MVIHFDKETRSRADLKKVGAYRYANDPSTEYLCMALAEGDQEPVLWVPKKWRHLVAYDPKSEELLTKLSNPETLAYAHSAQFEISVSDAILEKQTGFKPPAHHQYRCTAAMGRRAALPSSLKKLAEALKLGEQKDARGQALIRKFCTPQKKRTKKVVGRSWVPEYRGYMPDHEYGPVEIGDFIQPEDDPEAFRELCDYCLQDVRVEQAIHKKLSAFELTGFPLDTFLLDITINSRGFPVNLDALHKADKLIDEETARIAQQFRQLTGVEHTQNAKFLEWLKARGFKHKNLQAATLEEVLEDEEFDDTTELGRALTLKKRVSYVSLKKVKSMIACAGPHDNRVRGTLLWHGTGPGRSSGMLVQPQNFKRPTVKNTEAAYQDIWEGCSSSWLEMVYGPTLEVVSSSIRHFIHDTEQTQFFDADYSAIQARVVCWLAGEEEALQQYRDGIDRYKKMASVVFNVRIEDVNPMPQRFIGKQLILGAGFGLGAAKFRVTCEKLGFHDLEKGLEFKAIKTYREQHPKIVAFWNLLETAAKAAINNPGRSFAAGKYISFFTTKTAGMNYLFMKLPSGRKIAYPDPKLEPQIRWTQVIGEELVDGEMVPITQQFAIINPSVDQVATVQRKDPKARMGSTITFYGQITGKSVWGRVSTYGGKLAENGTMGVETDVMNHGLINAEKAGYEVCTVVHDQAISYVRPNQTIEQFVALLTDLPDWAEGLPIAAEGAVVPFYKKG